MMTEVESCVRGHTMTESNRVWKKDTRRAAGGRWACLECKREDGKRATAKYQSNWARVLGGKVRGPNKMVAKAAGDIYWRGHDPERVMEEYAFKIATARLRYKVSKVRAANEDEVRAAKEQVWEAVERLAKDDSKKPWKYLQIKPEALAAWDTFDAKLQKARDTGKNLPNCEDDPGPWMDYDEDNLPTEEEAYSLCDGCPLLAECGLYAELERPSWGVWAGDVWVDGEIVTE